MLASLFFCSCLMGAALQFVSCLERFHLSPPGKWWGKGICLGCAQHSPSPNMFLSQQLSTAQPSPGKFRVSLFFPSQFVTATSQWRPAALPGPWHCPAPELAGPHLPGSVTVLKCTRAPSKARQQRWHPICSSQTPTFSGDGDEAARCSWILKSTQTIRMH